LGYKKFVLVAFDYTAGHEQAGTFTDEVKKRGGEIVHEIYVPLDVMDFSSYLSSIPDDADAVWALLWGAPTMRFITQFHEFGLKQKISLIGNYTLTDESYLQDMNKEAAKDIITAAVHSLDIDTPENKEFMKNYKAEYNACVNSYAYFGYVAAQVLVKALEATGGDVSDKDKLLDAIGKVKFVGPVGPFSFDSTHNAVINVCVRKSQIGPDGKLFNQTQKVYENVKR